MPLHRSGLGLCSTIRTYFSSLTLTSLRGHKYSSISTSDSSFADGTGFGFQRWYSMIWTPRARALIGRSDHCTAALSVLSTQLLSSLSTDCDELDRLACVSPVWCSLADVNTSVNIPESELTTTGRLSNVADVPQLFAEHESLELTADELLTADMVDVELAVCCGPDHGNDNAAEWGSIRQSQRLWNIGSLAAEATKLIADHIFYIQLRDHVCGKFSSSHM